MLISLKELFGYFIHATDGEIGKVVDFYFDEKEWKIRYLIVEPGSWINREKVLLSPQCVKKIDLFQKCFNTSLDKARVANSPDIDTKKPVSVQMENDLSSYYRWPFYWNGVGVWGT